MARYAILSTLAAGGIIITVEGALIGIWRVWFSDAAPLFLRLTVPSMILAMGIVIGAVIISSRRAEPSFPTVSPAPHREHAGLR
jgi:hypothetical protein